MASTTIPINPNPYSWSELNRKYWHLASDDLQRFYQHWFTYQTDGAPEAQAPYVLELSPAGPPLRLLPETQGRLLVRKSYPLLLKRIYDAQDLGTLLLGDRNTGKSMFLWYALVTLLKQKYVVMFHWRAVTYLFFLGKVFYWNCSMRRAADPPPHPFDHQYIWSLIDMDTEPEEPLPPLTKCGHPRIFPIQASFPSTVRYRRWQKQASPATFLMPLWDEEELLEGFKLQTGYTAFYGAVQHLLNPQIGRAAESGEVQTAAERAIWNLRSWSDDPREASIDTNMALLVEVAMQWWGADPCSVNHGLLHPVQAQDELASALQSATGVNIARTIKAFLNGDEFPLEGLHALFAMHATRLQNSLGPNDYRSYRSVHLTLDFKSPRIGMSVMRILRDRQIQCIYELHRYCRDRPVLAPLERWLTSPFDHVLVPTYETCPSEHQELIALLHS